MDTSIQENSFDGEVDIQSVLVSDSGQVQEEQVSDDSEQVQYQPSPVMSGKQDLLFLLFAHCPPSLMQHES